MRYAGKTFVINLDRSADRWRFMCEQADRIGIEFERIRAVDGAAVPKPMRWEFLNSDGTIHSKLTGGEVGCYASHLVTFQRVLDDHLPYALILEDDSVLPSDLLKIAGEAVANCPGDWDIIHLSSVLKGRHVIPVAALSAGRHIVRHSRLPVNTWGYLVSAAGAAKLNKPDRRVRPIDMEFRYAWVRGLEIYGVSPTPIRSREDFTTTIDSDWRTKPLPKGQWAPGVLSRLYGEVYRKRRVLNALAQCYFSGLGHAKSRSSAIEATPT